MNTIHAILAKNEKLHGGFVMNDIDYRAPRSRYEEAYSKEQIEYLFKNNLLQKYEPCGACWEYPGMEEYWEFTKRGIMMRKWCTHTIKEYLYYEVFHLYNIKLYWQKLRIKLGHKYPWQEYEDVDISEI